MTVKEILEWKIVNVNHKTQRSIYHLKNCVLSVLCSDNGNNKFTESEICFRLPKSPQYSKDFIAMQHNYAAQIPFNVFKKIDKNQWVNLGPHQIQKMDETEKSNYLFIFYSNQK